MFLTNGKYLLSSIRQMLLENEAIFVCVCSFIVIRREKGVKDILLSEKCKKSRNSPE
jgi:hypothetical protein